MPSFSPHAPEYAFLEHAPLSKRAQVEVVLDTTCGETLQRSMHVVKRRRIVVLLLERPSQEVRELAIHARKITAALPLAQMRLAAFQFCDDDASRY